MTELQRAIAAAHAEVAARIARGSDDDQAREAAIVLFRLAALRLAVDDRQQAERNQGANAAALTCEICGERFGDAPAIARHHAGGHPAHAVAAAGEMSIDFAAAMADPRRI